LDNPFTVRFSTALTISLWSSVPTGLSARSSSGLDYPFSASG
jgi:hypothetical protein